MGLFDLASPNMWQDHSRHSDIGRKSLILSQHQSKRDRGPPAPQPPAATEPVGNEAGAAAAGWEQAGRASVKWDEWGLIIGWQDKQGALPSGLWSD